MEIWLQQQATAVLTALSHAQQLYGGSMPTREPRPFAPPPDLESELSRRLAVTRA